MIDIHSVTSSTELLNCLHSMASVLYWFCCLGYNDFIKKTAVSSRTSGLAFSLFSDAYVTCFAQCIAGTRCFGMRRTEHLESRRKDVRGNLLWNSNLYKSVVFSWNSLILISWSFVLVPNRDDRPNFPRFLCYQPRSPLCLEPQDCNHKARLLE